MERSTWLGDSGPWIAGSNLSQVEKVNEALRGAFPPAGSLTTKVVDDDVMQRLGDLTREQATWLND